MKTISRYIMTLALLLTAVSGAWATDPNAVTAAEINSDLYSGWTSIDGKLFKASELPGFQAVTEDQAKSWAGVPSTGYVILYYEFVADGNVKAVRFENGVYVSSFEEDELERYLIYEDIAYMGETRYFYTTGPAPAPEPDVEVTTNAAEEGATFTEATFAMPAFDATAEYELVRDMGYKVAFSGVPTRARLAKDGDGKFHFADGLTFQLLDNIDAANPKDITSAEGITFMVGEVEAVVVEGNTFYQLNKATLVPLADFLADAHLGNYAICAVASTGEYDGSFTSDRITLFQGYEVEVAAKEFITYYKDEPLYVEDEAAELYTIESVNGDQAVLSDRSDAMPSNTPMLVYNKSNETKVILLIPCAEPDMAITVAPEFQGTLTGTTIAASTEGQTNYAFNGKAFVFVKNAIEVGPNKAWLSVNTGEPSARITLVFDDETTKIANTNITNLTNGNWYDLNGRKLDKMPTKKGVYMNNGRKVVVK
jgi:hypothetical protein